MSTRRVLAVVPDLFFATRIAATAKQQGVELELVPAARAVARLAESPGALVLVELQAPGACALVRELKAAGATAVVGFYPHTDVAIRKAAIEAGADAVLPRSQFVTRLVPLLTHGLAALKFQDAGEGSP